MAEGFIQDVAAGASDAAEWISGPPVLSWTGGVKTRRREKYFISAYRCPSCGLLEAYARDVAP